MSDADLLAWGFTKHPNTSHIGTHDWLFQKRVTDENGTRYFVNVEQYEWRRRFGQDRDGWMCKVTYNGGCTFWPKVMYVETNCDDRTPAEVLAWAAELWQRLTPNYYERKL